VLDVFRLTGCCAAPCDFGVLLPLATLAPVDPAAGIGRLNSADIFSFVMRACSSRCRFASSRAWWARSRAEREPVVVGTSLPAGLLGRGEIRFVDAPVPKGALTCCAFGVVGRSGVAARRGAPRADSLSEASSLAEVLRDRASLLRCVRSSGALGTVSCGRQGLCGGGPATFRGVDLVDTPPPPQRLTDELREREPSLSHADPADDIVSTLRSRGFAVLRANSVGTVTSRMVVLARPAMLESGASKARWQLTRLRRICSCIFTRFSWICKSSISLLLKCLCDTLRLESCVRREL